MKPIFPINKLETYCPIEITNIEIEEINFNKNDRIISIQFSIGNDTHRQSFELNDEAYVYRNYQFNMNGIIFDKVINETIYSVFITSQELSDILNNADLLNNKARTNLQKVNCYYSEMLKFFGEFTVYFLRPSVKNEFAYEIHNDQTHFIFKEIYHSLPDKDNNFKEYLKIEFPNKMETIIELKNCSVNVLPINEMFNVNIGNLTLNSVKGYVFLFPLGTLMEFQNRNYGNKTLKILLHQKYYNLPNLPMLLNDLREKYCSSENYCEIVYGSNILYLTFALNYIDTYGSNNLMLDQIDSNNLIAISKYSYDAKEEVIEELKEEELPFNQIIFTLGFLSPQITSLVYLEDYDEKLRQDQWERDNRWHPNEDQPIDMEWEGIDREDKLHYDPDRAWDELTIFPEFDIDREIPEEPTFYDQWISEINNVLDTIHVVSLSSSEIEFKIEMEFRYYRNKISRIERFSLVKGLDVYTGVLRYIREFVTPGQLFIPFVVMEKANKYLTKQIITNLLGYRNYRKIKTKYFDFYFNKDFEKYICSGID